MSPARFASCAALFCLLCLCADHAATAAEQDAPKPVKVFILAGDDMVLEHAPVSGRTDGKHDDFFANAQPTSGERQRHVNVAVYQTDDPVNADFDKRTPVATGLVEIGDQKTRQKTPGQRGRVPVPMTPFPEAAGKPAHTTVINGYLSVKYPGRYAFQPGTGKAAFNVTRVEGKEVYRRDVGDKNAKTTHIKLKPGKRYAFETVYFAAPNHDFRVQLLNKPGTLDAAVDQIPGYSFLKDKQGHYVERTDAVLADIHPIHNNTEAPARPIMAGVEEKRGPYNAARIGVDLMLGHRLGDAYDQPVLILRFGTIHRTWFKRGSRDLSHDYRPPSSGGGSDLDGSWDVIHFNHGVWDSTYDGPDSKYNHGHGPTTTPEAFGKNLETLVKKMKKTGATLVWGSVTPVWEGEPGKPNGDVDAYNRQAERVMKKHGVIINDLNAEVRRQGYPKSNNVHSVGNLAPKVTETIRAAIAARDNNTRPLPRVLFIGDSITGTYWKKVSENLEGEAVVFKNPGNAEDTWNGLERIDQWIDLDRYLLNGQEYLELVDGIKKSLGEELPRVYPGYQGQGVDLAGLFWFQGIADTGSEAKARAYRQHLPNLIRDLRQDLGQPGLPVVVAALTDCDNPTHPPRQAVFEAQMAVGDPERFPEFRGNVISIDTRPACQPRELSPGGRDPFNGNALSYLWIGDAMAQAMLKMRDADAE